MSIDEKAKPVRFKEGDEDLHPNRKKDYSELIIEVRKELAAIEQALQRNMYGIASTKAYHLACSASELNIFCTRLLHLNYPQSKE